MPQEPDEMAVATPALMGLGVALHALHICCFLMLGPKQAVLFLRVIDAVIDVVIDGEIGPMRDAEGHDTALSAFRQFAVWWRQLSPTAPELRRRVLNKLDLEE
jgi:hypothetical protein